MKRPLVRIAMFVHDEERHLREAVESLLAQTYPHFRLIILDDCSRDRTPHICREYAQADPRVSFHRNRRRRGYVANYFKTFALAEPETDYFAWAAGHDRHHPQWLEALLAALEDNPRAVLAWPLTAPIDDNGDPLPGAPVPRYHTAGLDRRQRIVAHCSHGHGAGHMIYGLFRYPALRRAGVFSRTLLPDQVLLAKLVMEGQFVQVPRPLWYRRFDNSHLGTWRLLQRQRRIAFNPPPWYLALPWPVVNAAAVLWHTTLRPGAGDWRRRRDGLLLSLLWWDKLLRLAGEGTARHRALISPAVWYEALTARLPRRRSTRAPAARPTQGG